MSDSETIARPYTKAVYELASESGSLDDWIQFLDIAGQFAADSSVMTRMSAPDFLDTLCRWIDQCLQKTDHGKMNKQEHNFMKLLDAHNRLSILPAIAEAFRHLCYQSDGFCQATVYTAQPLEADQQSAIKMMLEKKTGCKVVLAVEDQPELIAGVRIEYDGLVIDQSAQGRIKQFALKLDELRN